METYANLSGQSTVKEYEIGPDYITISFRENGSFLYTHEKPGRKKVDIMKLLAEQGMGLGAFLIHNVKGEFFRKIV